MIYSLIYPYIRIKLNNNFLLYIIIINMRINLFNITQNGLQDVVASGDPSNENIQTAAISAVVIAGAYAIGRLAPLISRKVGEAKELGFYLSQCVDILRQGKTDLRTIQNVLRLMHNSRSIKNILNGLKIFNENCPVSWSENDFKALIASKENTEEVAEGISKLYKADMMYPPSEVVNECLEALVKSGKNAPYVAEALVLLRNKNLLNSERISRLVAAKENVECIFQGLKLLDEKLDWTPADFDSIVDSGQYAESMGYAIQNLCIGLYGRRRIGFPLDKVRPALLKAGKNVWTFSKSLLILYSGGALTQEMQDALLDKSDNRYEVLAQAIVDFKDAGIIVFEDDKISTGYDIFDLLTQSYEKALESSFALRALTLNNANLATHENLRLLLEKNPDTIEKIRNALNFIYDMDKSNHLTNEMFLGLLAAETAAEQLARFIDLIGPNPQGIGAAFSFLTETSLINEKEVQQLIVRTPENPLPLAVLIANMKYAKIWKGREREYLLSRESVPAIGPIIEAFHILMNDEKVNQRSLIRIISEGESAREFIQTIKAKKFEVSTKEIDDNPLRILESLNPFLAICFPKIEYIGSPGLDVGGLSRDFVTRLMKVVFSLQEKHLDVIELDGKIIPLINHDQPKQIRAYQTIGAIFATALEGRPEIVTGNYFHPLFFKMIHSLTEEEIDAFQDSGLLADEKLREFEDIPNDIINKLFRIYAESYLKLNPVQIQQILDRNIPPNFMGVEELTIDDFFNPIFKKMVLCCGVIAQSIRSHLKPETWDDDIQTISYDVLATRIEGILTKEAVLQGLDWNKEHEASKRYLRQWVQESSMEQLENFVWAVTGSKTLVPGKKMNIRLYEANNRLPTFHTCEFTMDLPSGYPSYEIFKEKFEQSLTSVEGIQAI